MSIGAADDQLIIRAPPSSSPLLLPWLLPPPHPPHRNPYYMLQLHQSGFKVGISTPLPYYYHYIYTSSIDVTGVGGRWKRGRGGGGVISRFAWNWRNWRMRLKQNWAFKIQPLLGRHYFVAWIGSGLKPVDWLWIGDFDRLKYIKKKWIEMATGCFN